VNGAYQLLVDTVDVNIAGENMIHAKRKNTEALLVTSLETGLEVNAEKAKHMTMSHEQNVRRHSAVIGNKSFQSGQNLEYLETTQTNQNCIRGGNKRKSD
jgi:hypothetical protein